LFLSLYFLFRSWLIDCLSEFGRKKDEYIQKWYVLEFVCLMFCSYICCFIFIFFLKSSQSTNFYDGYERLTVILEEMTKVLFWLI
jgi:hypothetical protein